MKVMMKYKYPFLIVCSLFLLPMLVSANSMSELPPPIFLDPVPNDTTVSSRCDIPLAIDLMAQDDMNNTFSVSPVDSPMAEAIDSCVGDTIVRTWTADDGMGQMTSVSQTIIVLADTEAPVTTFAEVHDTISCDMNSSLNYSLWNSSLLLGISSNATDNCSGIFDITSDAPPSYEEMCNTLTVTFQLIDSCGNSRSWVATYTVIDTVAPVFINAPNDTTLSCTEAIPAVPTVTAMDNCAGSRLVSFSEFNTQLMDGTCNQYEYVIRRTWTASDECGNMAEHVQIIDIKDDEAPDFTAPSNIVLDCSEDPYDLNVAGNMSSLSENCSPLNDVMVSYSDSLIEGTCAFEYQINRTWRAEDLCGNVRGKVQTIYVRDNVAPTFDVPQDITIDCSQSTDVSVTGEPQNVSDNCDPAPEVTFSDVTIAGTCVNTYSIERTWVVSDSCGNAVSHVQNINVRDIMIPSFVDMPEDMIVACAAGANVDSIFNEWVNDFAGGTAVDNCTHENNLTWEIYNEGTSDAPSLPLPVCPAGGDTLRTQLVDVFVVDECDNFNLKTVRFSLIDNVAPVLSNCPDNQNVNTDPGTCSADFDIIAPTIEDDCSFGAVPISTSSQQPITNTAVPGFEGITPVDDMNFLLGVSTSNPINAINAGTLNVHISNVDGEGDTEFFYILGEDGGVIGQTGRSPDPCTASDTTLTLTTEQINSWASDGQFYFRLIPNEPDGLDGRYAINDICPGGSIVTLTVEFNTYLLDGVIYEYSIDGLPRVEPANTLPQTENLSQGTHLITYYATDCAGNVDSCSYNVVVRDNEAPVLTCPGDVDLYLAQDSCTATHTLPLPLGVMDNCTGYDHYDRTLPFFPADAFLTYSYDPNLNMFQADSKVFEFTDVAANAFGDVTLIINYLGDFNSNDATMDILGEDGSVLGTTMVGDADCSTTGQITVTIPDATFNTWAADGVLMITLQPNIIFVPPGVSGDGVNPCNPAVVQNDGDNDGVSYAYASLSYDRLSIGYYGNGATTINYSFMTPPSIRPSHEFELGTTTMEYLIIDQSGNSTTCNYDVNVLDTISPIAVCVPASNLFIDPSGLQVEVLDAVELDNGSTDNCAIVSYTLSPNTFTCDETGAMYSATLTVSDASGNEGTCTTDIFIASKNPEPTASSGLCGGDTLYLNANPPPTTGGSIYTFEWYNPDGQLFSTDENVVIPNIDVNGEGPYRVDITGLTGCVSSGVVNVNVESLPLTPTIEGPTAACLDDDIILTTPNMPSGNGVVFYWYEGLPSGGTLLDSTSVQQYVITAPHSGGLHNYYLEVKSNGCISIPSDPIQVDVVMRPIAQVTYSDTSACEGTTIMLGTLVSNPELTYNWSGPNLFQSNQQFPEVGSLNSARQGYYILTVDQGGGCVSEPDSVLVTVKPQPAQPILMNNGPVCDGDQLILSTTSIGNSSYHWVAPNNMEQVTLIPSYTIPSVNLGDGGDWHLYTIQNGCASEVSLANELVVNQVPVAMAEAVPSIVCVETDFELVATPDLAGASYLWSGPGISDQNTREAHIGNASLANEGNYSLTITTAEGCVDTTSVDVEIAEKIDLLGVSTDAPACLGSPTDITLTASVFPLDDGSYSYNWVGPNSMAVGNSRVITLAGATESVYRGEYYLTVTSSDGCETVLETPYFLDVQDNPNTPERPFTVDGNYEFCEGETIELFTNQFNGNSVNYYWELPDGSSIATATRSLTLSNAAETMEGTYEVYVIVDGCISSTSDSRYVTVHPIPDALATSNTPVCYGDDIELSTNFYVDGTYEWQGPDGFNSGLQEPMHNSTLQMDSIGQYWVLVTVAGCTSDTSFIDVAVKDRPSIPDVLSVTDDAICADHPNASIHLGVEENSTTMGATYTWYNDVNGETAIAAASSNPEIMVNNFANYPEDGTYAFYVQADLDGCLSELSDPYNIDINYIPELMAFAGMDTVVCDNESMILAGTIPTVGTGRWMQVAGTTMVNIANPTSAETPVSALDISGSPYGFSWILSNGACVDYSADTINVVVSEAELADGGDNIVSCWGELINLNATAPTGMNSTAIWTQPSAQDVVGIVIDDPVDPYSFIEGLTPDNIYSFTWVVTSDCGVSSDEVLVRISDPDADAGDYQISCNEDATSVLMADRPVLGSNGVWTSPDMNIDIALPTSDTTDVSNLQVGANMFIWTIDDGICADQSLDTTFIYYKQPPVLEDDVIGIPFGESTVFDVEFNDVWPVNSEVSFTPINADGTITIENGNTVYHPPYNYVGEEVFLYEVTSEGCPVKQAEVTFDVGKGATCKAPSIITPNGDGINDVFIVPCLLDEMQYPDNQVIIFNRWGDEVYRSEVPYPSNWGGKYNGEDLPDGTYFYIVEFGDGSDPLTGFVVIQR